MRRPKRFAAALLVAAALAPAVWLADPYPGRPDDPSLRFGQLAVTRREMGPIEVENVWRVTSPHFWFGSYSALVALGDGALLAGSDRGWTLRFAPPGGPATRPEFAPFITERKRRLIDLEALARDPASGSLWAAYEFRNVIVRREIDGSVTTRYPRAMRRWPLNGGAEAMMRLADGRFVVLGEGGANGDFPGLMFDGDPAEDAAAVRFRFAARDGYRPVDIAAMPDGRALVLLRRVEWGVPPGFTAQLAVADPRTIGEGQVWQAQVLATLAPPLPTDNFEGLAVEQRADGSLTVWLVSDDNRMAIQRTLLMKLRWRP